MTIAAVLVVVAASAALLYVGWAFYRGVRRVLDDPDTYRLFDDK